MTGASEEPIPGALAARMQDDPWARALGVEYLEIRRGYCLLGLALQPHTVNEARQVKQGRRAGFYEVTVSTDGGTRVAQVHCVAHRVTR